MRWATYQGRHRARLAQTALRPSPKCSAGSPAMHCWSYLCSITVFQGRSSTARRVRFSLRKAVKPTPSFANMCSRAGAIVRHRNQSKPPRTPLRSPPHLLSGAIGHPARTHSTYWLRQTSISSLLNQCEQNLSSTGASGADHQERSIVASSSMCAGAGSSTPARCITVRNPRGFPATGSLMHPFLRHCGWRVLNRPKHKPCSPNL